MEKELYEFVAFDGGKVNSNSKEDVTAIFHFIVNVFENLKTIEKKIVDYRIDGDKIIVVKDVTDLKLKYPIKE